MDGRIIIVSGVPRSGTSLMMRVLRDSGVPVVADEGWSFEYSLAGTLTSDPASKEWVSHIPPGSAIKVLYPPLLHMPMSIPYYVIWMSRKSRECAKSLRKLGSRPRGYISKASKNIAKINIDIPTRLGKEMSLSVVRFERLVLNPKLALQDVELTLGIKLNTACVFRRDPKFSGLPLGTLETKEV